jgi:hypothetical protein
MFVGHYGVSFAVKRVAPTIPLWALFIAAQLLDVFWAPFILLGIEKVRIVPGITASNPFDLYYMPYTHSLLAALLWSAGALAAYNTAKVGLGLWNLPALAFVLEAGLLFGGMWLYLSAAVVPPLRMVVFGLVMLAIQAYVFFGPPPRSDKAAAWTALVAYAAAVVARLEVRSEHLAGEPNSDRPPPKRVRQRSS